MQIFFQAKTASEIECKEISEGIFLYEHAPYENSGFNNGQCAKAKKLCWAAAYIVKKSAYQEQSRIVVFDKKTLTSRKSAD